MFAVVAIAGFQEMVREGDTLHVPLMEAKKGDSITFDQVLLLADGDAITLGSPLVAGASVAATVVEHGRDDKIRVVKNRRRKRYTRVHGHRQHYTEVVIGKIAGPK